MRFLAAFVVATVLTAYWFLTKLLLVWLPMWLEPLAMILCIALAIYVLTWGFNDGKSRK
jgi:hypothetical protein